MMHKLRLCVNESAKRCEQNESLSMFITFFSFFRDNATYIHRRLIQVSGVFREHR